MCNPPKNEVYKVPEGKRKEKPLYSTLIEPEELQTLLGSDLLVVLDCRFDLKKPLAGSESYLKEHIPTAIYVDLERDLSGPLSPKTGRHPLPSVEKMTETFSLFGITDGIQVVAYDDSDSSFAARAWWMLQYLGHDRAAVLNGGFTAWTNRGYAVETKHHLKPRRVFKARPQKSWLVEVDQVADLSLVVDSRDPARYRGEVEPIDPVAGHIPGARNLFYRNHLDSDLRWKGRQEISENLKDLTDSPTFYCGSGVTACVNVLAAKVAGVKNPRLYAGSWSEWIRDPSRPVETANKGLSPPAGGNKTSA